MSRLRAALLNSFDNTYEKRLILVCDKDLFNWETEGTVSPSLRWMAKWTRQFSKMPLH